MRRLQLTILLTLPVNLLVSQAEAGELFRRGDINQDAAFDISDAVFVFRFLFVGAERPGCEDAADVNDDGAIDISDGISILNHLFQGGPAPAPPSPTSGCAGPDLTPDGLSCLQGDDENSSRPSLEAWFAVAPAPGIRQRSRRRVLFGDEAFVVDAGTSFSLVLVAGSNRGSRAGFDLLDVSGSGARPDVLKLSCDGDLGDPTAGGLAAGENLAAKVSLDIDPWVDDLFLAEHHSLKFDSTAAWSPDPGLYRFSATVVDMDCARSAEIHIWLRVVSSSAPDLLARYEVDGMLTQHHPGSGRARLASSGDQRVVFSARANGKTRAPVDRDSISLWFRRGGVDAIDRTADLEPVDEFEWSLSLTDGELTPGNHTLSFSATSEDGAEAVIDYVLEAYVDYERDIQSIWTANCTGCHERPDPFQGLEIVGRSAEQNRRAMANVFASEPAIGSTASLLIRSYFPERSYLILKLRGTHLEVGVDGSGARMPLDGGFLDDATMHLIESWVLQGAE